MKQENLNIFEEEVLYQYLDVGESMVFKKG